MDAPVTGTKKKTRRKGKKKPVPSGHVQGQLLVASLPRGITQERLTAELQSAAGPFSSLDLKQGFAFVTYATVTDAEAALRQLRGLVIDGSAIAVELAGKKDQPPSAALNAAPMGVTLPLTGTLRTSSVVGEGVGVVAAPGRTTSRFAALFAAEVEAEAETETETETAVAQPDLAAHPNEMPTEVPSTPVPDMLPNQLPSCPGPVALPSPATDVALSLASLPTAELQAAPTVVRLLEHTLARLAAVEARLAIAEQTGGRSAGRAAY